MKIQGFIVATTTANQTVIININEIASVIDNTTDRYCKIYLTDGEFYPVFQTTSEVAELIKEGLNP